MRATRRLAGGILLLGSAFACVAPAPELASGEVPEWTLHRGLVIGSQDDPVYALWAVGGVLVDPDRVYVLMAQDGAIRIFTRDGEFVRDFGGRGAGPGELTRPTQMVWSGPRRISVGDVEMERFTFYDVDTGEAETLPYNVYAPHAHGTTRFVPIVVVSDSLAAAAPMPSSAAPGEGLLVTLPMVVLDTAGAVRDTLALLSMPTTVEITAGLVAQGAVQLSHPLETGDRWQFSPDGSSVAMVEGRTWTGRGPPEFGVTKVTADGDTLFHRRLAYEPQPVPDGYYDQEIEQFLDMPPIVDRRAFADAVRGFYDRTRYLPPVTRLRLGDDGTTWLGIGDDEGNREWLVLDDSGSSIGRFTLPARSRLVHASRAEAWVVEGDAFDIPYVIRYEIVR